MHGKENSRTEEKGKSKVIGIAAWAELLTIFSSRFTIENEKTLIFEAVFVQ